MTFSSRLNVDFFDIWRQKLNSWSSIEGVKFVGTFWTQYFTGFWKYKYISLGCTKSLSFYTAGSWEKRHNFGASQANIQLFLFCQGFRKKLALFMYGIGCYLFWYRSVSNDRISDPWPFQWLSRNLVLRRPGQMNILILATDEILMFGSIYFWIFHSEKLTAMIWRFFGVFLHKIHDKNSNNKPKNRLWPRTFDFLKKFLLIARFFPFIFFEIFSNCVSFHFF